MIFDVRHIAWNAFRFMISNLLEGSYCWARLNLGFWYLQDLELNPMIFDYFLPSRIPWYYHWFLSTTRSVSTKMEGLTKEGSTVRRLFEGLHSQLYKKYSVWIIFHSKEKRKEEGNDRKDMLRTVLKYKSYERIGRWRWKSATCDDIRAQSIVWRSLHITW